MSSKKSKLSDNAIAKLSFEEGMGNIEKLVEALDQGDLPLEQALDAYQTCVSTIRHCEGILQRVEEKIKVIEDDGSSHDVTIATLTPAGDGLDDTRYSDEH